MHRSAYSLILLCVLSLLLAGASGPPIGAATGTAAAQVTAAYWPTKGWRTSDPEAQGMDSQRLAAMLAAANDDGMNLHSLLVIRHGYVVSETYFGSYRQDTRHELYSCTKSFISTLIGIALDKGYIASTSQRVADFFPGRTLARLDERKGAMTLDDLLTMRSGLDWQEGDPIYQAIYRSPDWVSFVLDEPMAAPPGQQFNYCSGCTHVLSAIIGQATDMNTRAFADKYLFRSLGISNLSWETDPAGIPVGGWGLQLTPRDMAKLGYLYLHGGQWDGQQVVSAKWVENATQAHSDGDGNLEYGYQWWIYPSLAGYTALGRYGQAIFVIPRLDLVIVTTAQEQDHDAIFRLIEQYIVPAVQGS